jgi:hypothetical protein
MDRKLFFITIIIISIVIPFAGFTCPNKGEPGEPAEETSPGVNTEPSGQSSELPIAPIKLSPYPKGWVPGTEGFIPPLPPGINEPSALSQEEWDRVVEITRTDPEVTKQNVNNNIRDIERWWVAYGGGQGAWAEADSVIMSRKTFPPEGWWFYPAMMFLLRSFTDSMGILVAVDINSERVVFSSAWLGIVPTKPRPPGPGG